MKKKQTGRAAVDKKKQMDSLLVNGEAGDRTIGAAGSRSQYFPAERKLTYRPSAKQSHTSV